MNSKDNFFFLIIKKRYKNPFLFTAMSSDILTSDASSVVASHLALRKYKVLLSHERCRPAPVYS
jgi:hypothetical protein